MFKIGDRVKLVKEGPVGWESEDWAAEAGLELGKIYTVSDTDLDDDDASVDISPF